MRGPKLAIGGARRVLAATATLAMLLAAHAQAEAQAQRVVRPGERIQMEGGEAYQIIRCDGAGEWDECDVQVYQDGRPGNRLRMTIRNLRAGEQRRLDAEARAAAARGEAPPARGTAAPRAPAPPPRAPAAQQPRPTPASRGAPAGANGRWRVGDRLEVYHRSYWYPSRIVAIEGTRYRIHYEGYGSQDDEWVDASRMRPIGGHVAPACTYGPPGPAVGGQSTFSAALARRKIYDSYSLAANGTGSAPGRVGVTFMEFALGGTYQNTVHNVPGQGAQRRHAGAPAGATIHTLRSKHMVCDQYAGGEERRIVEGTFGCFRNRDGEWTCASENDTKITHLDQE